MRKVPLQPAEDDTADAGKKKRKKLIPEEQRLLQLIKERHAQENQARLKSMPEKEKNDDVTFFSCWATGWLTEHKMSSQQGPFSTTEMNGEKIRGRFFDPFLIKGLKYPVRNKSH